VIAQAAAELQQSRANEQVLVGKYNAVVKQVAAAVVIPARSYLHQPWHQLLRLIRLWLHLPPK
jgi:hypothetical protein